MSEHIVRRGARYYYRRRVPADLLSKLDGKREIQRSLGTSDPKEAARAARRMAVEVDDLFERLRTAPAHTPTAAARPVPLDVMLGEEWGQEEHELAPYTDADLLRAELTSIVRRVTGLESSARAFSAPPTAPAQGGHATVAAAPNHGGAALPEALTAWQRIRKPTAATVDTMNRVIERFRTAGGPDTLSAIQRSHLTAFVNTMDGSSVSTQRAYLSMFKALLSAAVSADLVPASVAASVRIEGKETAKARVPFSSTDLRTIIEKLPATGADRWIPLVAMYSGMRLNEIGQLRAEDLKHEHYRDANGKDHRAWVLYATDEGEGQRLKNASSRRRIPVHAELIRLGFLDYARAQKGGLFPELVADRTGRLTANFGRSFGHDLRKVYGITDPRKVFHSFRHLFIEQCRETGIPEQVQQALTGHTTGTASRGYGGAYFPLRPLVEAVEALTFHMP